MGNFWFQPRFFVKMMEVCYIKLRLADGTTTCMPKFFTGMLETPDDWEEVLKTQAIETEAIDREGFKHPELRARLGRIKERWAARWRYMHSPKFSVAYATDPEYVNVDLHAIDGGQTLAGVNMCQCLLIDFKERRRPEGDHHGRSEPR